MVTKYFLSVKYFMRFVALKIHFEEVSSDFDPFPFKLLRVLPVKK